MTKFSQTISLALLTSLLGSGIGFAQTTTTWPTKPFSDVEESRSDHQAIEHLRQQKVLKGYDDGTFRPDAHINRAELVKLIANPYIVNTTGLSDCIRENVSASGATVFFPDVPRTTWFAAELCFAKTNTIIGGYPDGTFQPGNYVNFVEAAKIIVSTFALQTQTDPTDERWFIRYVNELSERNAIPTTIKKFDDTITRGEMAEIMYRLKTHTTTLPSKTTGQIQ